MFPSPYHQDETVSTSASTTSNGNNMNRSQNNNHQEQNHKNDQNDDVTNTNTTLSTNNTTLSTPSPAGKVSRFHFLSDTRAPNELNRLESDTLKRRSQFRLRVNDLDRRIASWTAKLANETLERENVYVEMSDQIVYDPLEAAVERVMGRLEERTRDIRDTVHHGDKGHYNTNNGETKEEGGDGGDGGLLTEMERKMQIIQAKLYHHVHVSAFNARRMHLDGLRSSLSYDVGPALQLEKNKAIKREGGMIRRFESIAGLANRSICEETAERVTDLSIVESKIDGKESFDERRKEVFMEEIRKIRIMLEEEKKERARQDELVLENILHTKEKLEQAVLESLADT